MQVTKVIMPESKYGIKCPYGMIPQGITIHNTANDASAMAEISYMIGNGNEVSFHEAVDDYRVVQGIEHNRNAWASGDGPNGFGNRNTIQMEICYSKSGGERFDKAERNAAKRAAFHMRTYGFGLDRIEDKRIGTHKDRSGKYCPHRTLDRGWDRFINMVKEELGKTQNTPNSPPSNNVLKVVYPSDQIGLNVRSGAGTNYTRIGGIQYGTKINIFEINGNWGRTDNGWVCLTYTKGSNNTPSVPQNKYSKGRYKVNTSAGLNIRSKPDTNSAKVYNSKFPNGAYPNGQEFDVLEVSGSWGRSPSGWLCLDYATMLYKF